MVSPYSANAGGCRRRLPWAAIDLMTGEVFGPNVSYLNPPVSTAVRPFSVTTTSTGPAIGLAGVLAAIVSAPRTLTSVAGLPPTDIMAPVAKATPRIVISVPPLAGPVAGATELIARSVTGPGLVGEQVAARTATKTAAARPSAWRRLKSGTPSSVADACSAEIIRGTFTCTESA